MQSFVENFLIPWNGAYRIIPVFFADFVGICGKRTVVLRVRVSVKSTNVASDCQKFSFRKVWILLLMYCVDEKYGSEFLLSNRYHKFRLHLMNIFQSKLSYYFCNTWHKSIFHFYMLFFHKIYYIAFIIFDMEAFSSSNTYWMIEHFK